ncbi:hypothetical protein BDW68DRAFT_182436 [Aspergillus falconensis]
MSNTSRRFLAWDPKFTKRNEQLYAAENQKIVTFQGRSKTESFLTHRVHKLMPDQYRYAALRELLERDPLGVNKLEGTVPIVSGSRDDETTILLDKRRDPSPLNTFSSRYGAEYTQYPPEGEATRLEALSAKEFEKNWENVRRNAEACKYIRDLSPLCALALVLPVAVRYAPALREFLSKYIASRAFFGISIDYPIRPASTYTFEFHIPYFALRRAAPGVSFPPSHVNRRKGKFQASFSVCAGDEKEFFHEAQISVLLVGIDEWVWTLYCLVETHFSATGPEDVGTYVQSGRDAPSGEGANYSMPIWNPREYFLLILSRRMSEVKFEWSNLVQTLETRVKFLEEDTFSGPTAQRRTEDQDLKLTNDYTWAIQALQLFSNQLIKTIEAWDEFSDKHLHILHPDERPADFLPKIASYLESLDTDISELRYINRTIARRIEAFESKRSNVTWLYSPVASLPWVLTAEILNTSALVEARVSNSQADNIGLLTKVTVV